jgi:hypothetical protein
MNKEVKKHKYLCAVCGMVVDGDRIREVPVVTAEDVTEVFFICQDCFEHEKRAQKYVKKAVKGE